MTAIEILIGNDDGINNIGIDALANEANKWGNITIVAPEKQQSARAKSLTFHKPIRFNKTTTLSDIPAFSYNSSPADSILIYNHLKGKPDVALSGINSGDNTSIHSILTSGTAAVAMEAGLQNIPAFALSMDVPESFFFKDEFPGNIQRAAEISVEIAKTFFLEVTAEFWQKALFINVNFPDIISDETQIVLVELETYKYNNYLVERVDPKGMKYHWLWGKKRKDFDQSKDSYKLFHDKCITVTPVSMIDTEYLFDVSREVISKLQ